MSPLHGLGDPDRRARNDWVARKLPSLRGERRAVTPFSGASRSSGELTHSHLNEQGIRGTPEEHDTAAKDAIGDLIVYLLGVANAHIDPNTTILRGRQGRSH